MLRPLAVLLVASAAALAQAPPKLEPIKPADPTKPADTAKAPPAAASISIVTVAVKDGALQSAVAETYYTTVQETVDVKRGDVVVKETRTKTVPVTVMKTVEHKLKDVKVTGTDGKEIAADDVEKKLKDNATVVMHTGKLGDDARKLFKDGTLFIEKPAAMGPASPLSPAPPVLKPIKPTDPNK